MAKRKYFDKKAFETVHESCECLIKNYIVPNSIEEMGWQAFREGKLWTLDVDDLFKVNL